MQRARTPRIRPVVPPHLILASNSPRRRELLLQIGLRFEVLPSRYLEGVPQGDPATFALNAARHKAAEVAERVHAPGWVLAADTLVAQAGQVFGKPANREQASRMLRGLSGKTHKVVTGVALRETQAGEELAWVEVTAVSMRVISSAELEGYLRSGEWKDKAGGYGIQGRAGAFVKGIRGCYFNVVGLPLARLTLELGRRGLLPC